MSQIEPITRTTTIPLVTDFHLPIYDTTPRSKVIDFESSRPLLDPPGTKGAPFFISLSSFVETLSSIESLYLDVVEVRMKDSGAKYVENYQKNLSQSRELEEQEKGRTWWTFLQKIAHCLLAATALMSGGILFSTAATCWELAAGGAMVVSGVTTVLGVALNEIHAHPEVAAILQAVGAAMGLMGGAATALFANATSGEMAGKIVVAAIGIVSASADLAKESYAIKIAELKSANAMIHQVFEKEQAQMKTLTDDANFFTQRITDNIELCANIQKKYEQSIRKILLTQEYAG